MLEQCRDSMTTSDFLQVGRFHTQIIEESLPIIMNPQDPAYAEKCAILDQGVLGGWNQTRELYGVLRMKRSHQGCELRIHRVSPPNPEGHQVLLDLNNPSIVVERYDTPGQGYSDVARQMAKWGLGFVFEPSLDLD